MMHLEEVTVQTLSHTKILQTKCLANMELNFSWKGKDHFFSLMLWEFCVSERRLELKFNTCADMIIWIIILFEIF